MRFQIVQSVQFSPPFKTIEVGGGSKLQVSHSACVTAGDRISVLGNRYFVRCRNGLTQFLPAYDSPDTLWIGAKHVRVRVKEITDQIEFEAYDYLQSFHYRGKGRFGRHSDLVMVPNDPLLPRVIGYVTMSSSFLVNRPRDILLDARFHDGSGIGWSRWDYSSRSKLVNYIVRISRVVVHPEFRGLNLGKKLIRHALEFASDHWQIAHVKPLFVEITADMLKFVPFAEHAGMVFVGFTEGNVDRVQKDLRYLIQHRQGKYKVRKLHIPDMQGKYASQALTILEGNGLSLDGLLKKLDFKDDQDVDPKVYSLVHHLVRFPKPTLMRGLTKKSHKFLEQRARKLITKRTLTVGTRTFKVDEISKPITFRNVTLSFSADFTPTRRTCNVQEAFGISPSQLGSVVFQHLSLEIFPGEIILVCGSSGSGKTAFLDLLRGRLRPTNYPEGRVVLPSNSKIGCLKAIPSGKPLIEYRSLFGEDIADAIRILNLAGLSEPYLYLREYNELSEGQKYRAMIAGLLYSRSNIWIADDFLSSLDPITSNIVADNFQRFARSVGATVVVAAPHFEAFIQSLRPDRVLVKSYGWAYSLYHGREFHSIMNESMSFYKPPSILKPAELS